MKNHIKLIYSIIIVLILGITLFFIIRNIDSRKNMNEPEKVVFDFYNYYLRNIYGKIDGVENPSAKLDSNDIYQLDPTKYLKFLNESGFFSLRFYDNELPKFELCNKALKIVTLKEVNDSGGFPEDFVKNGDCDFVFYNPWVGGQGEKLNTVKIQTSQINGDLAKVVVVIGNKIGDQQISVYSYPIVNLVKESGQWKISSINVSFEKSR